MTGSFYRLVLQACLDEQGSAWLRGRTGGAQRAGEVCGYGTWAQVQMYDWTAHVSVAYANTTGPGDAYDKALTGENGTVDLLVDAVQLIVLGRDEHLYEWTTRADVPLGTS